MRQSHSVGNRTSEGDGLMLKNIVTITLILFFITYTVFLLCSCSSNGQKFINVPVPVKCSITDLPNKPVLPIKSLTDISKPDEVIKAYVASVYLLNEQVDILQEAMKVCS